MTVTSLVHPVITFFIISVSRTFDLTAIVANNRPAFLTERPVHCENFFLVVADNLIGREEIPIWNDITGVNDRKVRVGTQNKIVTDRRSICGGVFDVPFWRRNFLRGIIS